jgi:hypothetical protein
MIFNKSGMDFASPSGRQASDLHPLMVRPVVAATWSRRRADDLPQLLS